jgi:hypothetical protein
MIKIIIEKMEQSSKFSSKLVFTSVLLFIITVIALIILITDKNLQTDFGAVKPYYYHWYGLLFLAIFTFVCGILTLSKNSRLSRYSSILGGVIPLIFIIIDVFILYKSVGFYSYIQFAQYLFGISRYPYSLPYIPGLFDVYTALLFLELILALMIKSAE